MVTRRATNVTHFGMVVRLYGHVILCIYAQNDMSIQPQYTETDTCSLPHSSFSPSSWDTGRCGSLERHPHLHSLPVSEGPTPSSGHREEVPVSPLAASTAVRMCGR